MKLNIFSEEMDVVKPEKEVYFRFKQYSSGEVVVYVCSEKGEPLACGNLISFFPDGTMKKMGGVNSELGFQIDMGGHIKEKEDR